MKKTLCAVLSLVMLLALAACGESKTTVTVETPAPTVEVQKQEPVEQTAAPVEETEAPKAEEPAATVDEEAYQKALSLVDESVDELYSAIGDPISVDEYTTSCMGPGDDGSLHYQGFTVYTYRENGNEVVYDVVKD